MRSELAVVARLELRHARSDLRFLLFAAGVDIDEDRGFLERTYQLYLLALCAVVVVLSWAQVVSLVEGARAVLGSLAGPLALLLLALAPTVALAAWTAGSLRETPLRLIAPDIAWLARTVRPGALLAVRLVRNVASAAVVGGLSGYLLGVLALASSPLVWSALATVVLPAAWLLALLAGLARSAASRRLRPVVTLCAAVLAVLLAAALFLALPALVDLAGVYLVPVALLVDALLVVASLALAARADMAFVVDDNELYAARQSLRFLALVNTGAYREACRRRQMGRHRQARRTWRFRPGLTALVSHALVSLVRRPSTLLGVLSWGALVVPTGALLVAARVDAGVLLMWYLCVLMRLRDPLELTWVFREDCANRLVRPMLPVSSLALLALDSLPAVLVAAVASTFVGGGAAALLSGNVWGTVALSWALLAALVFSAGFDDPQLAARRGSVRPTAFLAGSVSLLVIGLVGLLGVVPSLVCAVVVDVLLVCLLR